jgi:hypothetical protein
MRTVNESRSTVDQQIASGNRIQSMFMLEQHQLVQTATETRIAQLEKENALLKVQSSPVETSILLLGWFTFNRAFSFSSCAMRVSVAVWPSWYCSNMGWMRFSDAIFWPASCWTSCNVIVSADLPRPLYLALSKKQALVPTLKASRLVVKQKNINLIPVGELFALSELSESHHANYAWKEEYGTTVSLRTPWN